MPPIITKDGQLASTSKELVKENGEVELKSVTTIQRTVYGVGITDIPCTVGNKKLKSYDTWKEMLRRCYSPTFLKNCATYEKCTVHPEWHTYSVFKEWFDANYVTGYDLDKDLLVTGNNEYSPDKCCYVPHSINMLSIVRKSDNGNTPHGVYFDKSRNKYQAYLSIKGKLIHLGRYSTQETAFAVYKNAREQYMKEMADEYYNRGEISELVYNALYRWTVTM